MRVEQGFCHIICWHRQIFFLKMVKNPKQFKIRVKYHLNIESLFSLALLSQKYMSSLMKLSLKMQFFSKILPNFLKFQKDIKTKPFDAVLWNFVWTNGRLYALGLNQSGFSKMDTLSTIKVLLVSVAFESRVVKRPDTRLPQSREGGRWR